MGPQKPSKNDLEDAVVHGTDGEGTLGEYSLTFLGNLTVDDLRSYDDIDAWLDLDPSDFDGMSNEEKLKELEHFRGHLGLIWLASGYKPAKFHLL